MRLYATPTSPYARKVRIVLAEKHLPYDLEWVDLRSADHPAKTVNPLGKIPVLVLNDGTPVYDSSVIVQYLDLAHPEPPLIPTDLPGRLRALRGEALADGIMDSTITWVMEQRHSSECQDGALLARMRTKVITALSMLQAQVPQWQDKDKADHLELPEIAAIAAIAYVDLRAPEFLLGFADLMAWYQRMRHRPSIADTAATA
ncbi:MAG: glutathione S-transferase N-terminal domain-containing protein [Acidithiobacillus caldus]|nr:glutathione S-transferase N-terminal domain-containing protein [Acidithiobacillus caldus]